MTDKTEFKAIEKHFPKGDKRRGEALVVNAEAYLLGKQKTKEEILEKIDRKLLPEFIMEIETWNDATRFIEELKRSIENKKKGIYLLRTL